MRCHLSKKLNYISGGLKLRNATSCCSISVKRIPYLEEPLVKTLFQTFALELERRIGFKINWTVVSRKNKPAKLPNLPRTLILRIYAAADDCVTLNNVTLLTEILSLQIIISFRLFQL